jgi:hypothetical protein
VSDWDEFGCSERRFELYDVRVGIYDVRFGVVDARFGLSGLRIGRYGSPHWFGSAVTRVGCECSLGINHIAVWRTAVEHTHMFMATDVHFHGEASLWTVVAISTGVIGQDRVSVATAGPHRRHGKASRMNVGRCCQAACLIVEFRIGLTNGPGSCLRIIDCRRCNPYRHKSSQGNKSQPAHASQPSRHLLP